MEALQLATADDRIMIRQRVDAEIVARPGVDRASALQIDRVVADPAGDRIGAIGADQRVVAGAVGRVDRAVPAPTSMTLSPPVLLVRI